MQHFKGSLVIAILGLLLAFYIGGVYALYIALILAVLEISLSFDNAVVNAKILQNMDKKWQKRFLTWGIAIAVFGMRLVFPIAIVAISSGLGVFETLNLALYNPSEYTDTLVSVESLIFAFGGAFLMMVFLDFIFENRADKWINFIEKSEVLHKLKKVKNIEMIAAMVIGLFLTYLTADYKIALAYFSGIFLQSIISSLDEMLNVDGIRNGLMGFLYLEVLDASFSFDGVIGAFALSSDIFIIMIGLGIGALFIRSLTLLFVAKKTLQEYKYLEHGAHYAIFALAIIMFLKIFTHINELIVGTVGVAFIAASLYHSVASKKKRATAVVV